MRGWDMTTSLVQGNHPRPLGGYQPAMMEPHSPAPAWHMHTTMKQEPMDEDRNDSGINSGSDFHSSSPGSDNSREDYNAPFTSPTSSTSQVPYYNTPVTSQYIQQLRTYPGFPPFNPLTPPSSDAVMSPRETKSEPEATTTLTPRSSPSMPQDPKTPSSTSSGEESDDPLRRLRMSFEKDGFLPSVLSPKTTSEHSNDDNVEEVEGDEENIKIPKMNSHGKVKTFKCKQCDFVAITKLDFWEHSKMHIKTDKQLTCPRCPFVTEYKHHLEYHMRNHSGSKPFKCDKCNYSCVNKSMLNSHMKSHSNIYQYRCSDCSYATKYCHSLKLHLRKYSHKPAMVLNPDGTPNPLPIIDVYGTRRGPKMKQSQREEEVVQQTPPQQPPNPFAQLMMGSAMNFPYPFMQGFPGALANPMFFPQLAQQLSERNRLQQQQLERMSPEFSEETPSTALDLSKNEPSKNRRKGRAFKIERPQQEEDEDDEEEEAPIPLSLVAVVDETPVERAETVAPTITTTATEINNDFVCQFCKISFGDLVLYTMHMGYHGYKDPFTCNMCGEQCTDKVAFFLHIARNPHT